MNVETASRYKPYPRYKKSRVEWLGQIPDGWNTQRLRFAAPVQREKLDIKPHDAPYLGLEQIESGTGRLSDNASPEVVESSVSRFKRGDVLFGKLRPYLAKALEPEFDGVCTSELVVLKPTQEILSRYLLYQMLVRGHVDWLNAATYGTKMPRLSPQQINDSFIACPSIPEQRAIAEFLDRETAKIDELIARKERLLELLEEKRPALITHAVTRGLNPDAPLRDSGIEWLGQIPEHWEVRPLKNEFRFEKGHNSQLLTASYINDNEGEYPVYSGQTENDGIMGFLSSYEYDVPEVLFATTVGAKAMTPMTLKGKFSLSQNCLIMRPKRNQTVTRFFYYQLHPLFGFERASIPAHMQPSLRISDLRSYAVACPAADEQNKIASYLDDASNRTRSLSKKIEDAIERLTEYRAALITAAVTGKIDVRDQAGAPGSARADQ